MGADVASQRVSKYSCCRDLHLGCQIGSSKLIQCGKNTRLHNFAIDQFSDDLTLQPCHTPLDLPRKIFSYFKVPPMRRNLAIFDFSTMGPLRPKVILWVSLELFLKTFGQNRFFHRPLGFAPDWRMFDYIHLYFPNLQHTII